MDTRNSHRLNRPNRLQTVAREKSAYDKTDTSNGYRSSPLSPAAGSTTKSFPRRTSRLPPPKG